MMQDTGYESDITFMHHASCIVHHASDSLIAPLILLLLAFNAIAGQSATQIKVGSKVFTESVILGEIVAQIARTEGARIEHLRQLGGTRVLWDALLSGAIDTYPEYTGTITQEILA